MAQNSWEQIALPGVGLRPLELHRLDVVIDYQLRELYVAHTIRDAATGAPVFGELHPALRGSTAIECLREAVAQFQQKAESVFDPF